MKPIEHMPPIATLDFAPGLANGDMPLPLGLQAVAFFFQKDIGQHRQGPEAHNGHHAHQLVLIHAQFFFAIAKEDLNLQARRDMYEQSGQSGLQIAGGPVARLREWSFQWLKGADHSFHQVDLAAEHHAFRLKVQT